MDDYEIIDFTKFDKVKNYFSNYEKDYDGFSSIDIIKKDNGNMVDYFVEGENTEKIVYYNYKNWHNDMKKSFKSKDDMIKQFLVDFDRSNIFCNGVKVDNTISLMDYIELNCNKKQIRDIIMFCTQTSMAVPFEIIKKSLNKNESFFEYYLGEISGNKKSSFTINFDISENIHFRITKKLRVFKLKNHNDVTVSYVNILLDFNTKSKYVVFKFYFDNKII
jgi:hypothetical protein